MCFPTSIWDLQISLSVKQHVTSAHIYLLLEFELRIMCCNSHEVQQSSELLPDLAVEKFQIELNSF